MCTLLTLALPADANVEAISERIVRLDLGSELESTLFHLDGLSLRPVVKRKYCHCGTYLGSAGPRPKGRSHPAQRRLIEKRRKQGWSEARIARSLADSGQVLDRRQARYDEVAPDDTPGGNPWGQFIRETLAAGDAAAVGILINEGDYDTPLPEIVRLRSEEATVDTLTKLEDDVLYVFA